MLAAVAGTAELLDATTAGIVHAGTYNGNPVVLAAAKATLEALDEPGVYEGFERHGRDLASGFARALAAQDVAATRSEEHSSELQSRGHLVCRLLLEKK